MSGVESDSTGDSEDDYDHDWDWVKYVTPSGEVYYYAKSRRHATPCNMDDPNIRSEIEDTADGVLEEIEEQNPDMHLEDWDWWLEYYEESGQVFADEFVNHKTFEQAKYEGGTSE